MCLPYADTHVVICFDTLVAAVRGDGVKVIQTVFVLLFFCFKFVSNNFQFAYKCSFHTS